MRLVDSHLRLLTREGVIEAAPCVTKAVEPSLLVFRNWAQDPFAPALRR